MIKVEKIIPGGQALGTDDSGKKIFFWNALPGEIVDSFRITKNKSHYSEAIAETIQNPSSYRRQPKDVCFLSTSPWQIIDYDYELKLKQSLIVEFFREQKIPIETPDIITDQRDYYYRNKMEYALYWDKETAKISLAFHMRGSHQKIPIQTSSIERPEIFQAATKIDDELNQKRLEARNYQSLLLRCDQSGEVSGGLYEKHQPHPVFPNLTDEIFNQTYSYSPNGFFQINLPVYKMALQTIKANIKTDKVLDYYSGVGTIGLSTASDKELTLVEVDRFAFDELCRNIQSLNQNDQNSIKPHLYEYQSKNIRAIFDKSENVLSYIEPDATIILDPPRAGCDENLITKLSEIKPETIIYLSCNPATQARDVKKLLNQYKIKTIQTYNFFPHTPHIENLVILEKSC